MANDLYSAKAQVQQSRQQLEEQKKQVGGAKGMLAEAFAKIPSITKQFLYTLGSGISGRTQTRKVQSARGQIEGQLGQVESVERELQQYEQQIRGSEAQIGEAEAQQAGLRDAQKAFSKGVPTKYLSGWGKVYLKQMREGEMLKGQAVENVLRQIKKIEVSLPKGQELIVDPKTFEIKGIQDKTSRMSIGIGELTKTSGIDIQKLKSLSVPSIFSPVFTQRGFSSLPSPEIQQIGRPLFTEQEASRLTPSQLSRVTVVPSTKKISELLPTVQISRLPGRIDIQQIAPARYDVPVLPTPRGGYETIESFKYYPEPELNKQLTKVRTGITGGAVRTFTETTSIGVPLAEEYIVKPIYGLEKKKFELDRGFLGLGYVGREIIEPTYRGAKEEVRDVFGIGVPVLTEAVIKPTWTGFIRPVLEKEIPKKVEEERRRGEALGLGLGLGLGYVGEKVGRVGEEFFKYKVRVEGTRGETPLGITAKSFWTSDYSEGIRTVPSRASRGAEIITTTPIPGTSFGGRFKEFSLIDVPLQVSRGVEDVFEITGGKIETGSREFFKGLGTGEKVTKYGPKVLGFAPKAVEYSVFGGKALASEALAGYEKYRNVAEQKKEVRRLTEEGYKEYSMTYVPEEGFRQLTREEYVSSTYPEYLKQVKTQAAIETVVPLAFLGAGGIYKGGKAVFGEKAITRGGEIAESYFGVQRPVYSPAGEFTISGFRVTQKVSPFEKKVTTPFREFFGFAPKKEWEVVKKGFTKTAESVDKIFGGLPYEVQVGKLGKAGKLGMRTVYGVEGKQVPLEVSEFLKLPSSERKVIKETIEKAKLKGTPIADKFFPSVVSEEERIFRGYLKTTKLPYKVKIGKRKADIFPKKLIPGKTAEVFQTASILKEVKLPEGAKIKMYDVFLGGKRGTISAGGKVRAIPGKLIELPPITIGGEEFVKILKPYAATKTSLEQTFAKLKQEAIPFVPPIPKVPKPKVSLEKPSITGRAVELPLMVGGKGLKEIPFAGTGQYEVAEFGAVMAPRLDGQKALEIPKLKVSPTFVGKIGQVQRLGVGQLQTPRLKVDLKGRLDLKLKTKATQLERPMQRQTPRERVQQKQREKMALRLKLIPRLTPRLTPRMKFPGRPRPPKKPTKLIIPFLLPTADGGKYGKKEKGLVEGYLPYVIRKGKKVFVGKATTKATALRIGKGEVFKTAAVTFGVEKAGVKVKKKIGEIPFIAGAGVRGYKIVKGKKVKLADEFIQTRRKRISSIGELREITKVGQAKRRASPFFR